MAYQCNNCGPGCSDYSTHDYEGKGASGYQALEGEDFNKDTYNSNKYDDNKDMKDGYQANKEEDEDKKKEEEKNKEPTIDDQVDKETKETKKEEEQDEFKTVSNKISNEFMMQKKKTEKKKKYNDIEEAIKKAVKDEKEIVRLD